MPKNKGKVRLPTPNPSYPSHHRTYSEHSNDIEVMAIGLDLLSEEEKADRLSL